ncbi:choline transporter-like protein 1 isoform X5 [Lingula anatina]|uniref:Choline transporter-like protein n=1 Tax=Lingula anatina TaxID=7574 RepID=A0A1S3J0B4_LINAN|nr:choline transporter-like protein 1 isoform X4 [Lingula anatina]XP_013403887.1 choline transporter-like protein 1 isoform X5 [Lingula anatina]|eukprot:XP_013403885.1 choline transporter-like protein 1 isoform X4 [Lingula anatina]
MCGCCGCGDDGKDTEDGGQRGSNPMVKKRGCTDIIVLVVFILFWVGMVYITVFSIMNGRIWTMFYGYDSFGNACGMQNIREVSSNFSGRDNTNEKYVFFMDIIRPKSSLEVCVEKCPDRELKNAQELIAFYNETGVSLTRYDITPYECTDKDLQNTKGPCPVFPVHHSADILSRCIPASFSNFTSNLKETVLGYLNEFDIFRYVIADLYASWKLMLLLAGIAFVLAIAVVVLIRFIASVVVWVILALAIIGSLAGTGFLWWTYVEKKNSMDMKTANEIPFLQIEIDSENAFLAYSIIATILTVILLLVILVLRKRIALAVALFNEAGKCIVAVPMILVQPVWTFICLILFYVYWVVVLAYISTAGTAVLDKDTGFVNYEESQPVRYMWWYHLVGLIWTSEFIIACQQLVVAGAVAKWYFTRDKKTLKNPLGDAVCMLILHHMGSVAFGAFIITLVKLPRWILMYLHEKLNGSQNKCAQYCLKCCICCLWCLEKCLKFLNQNAYTIVAIRGTNFCSSARKAFTTIVSNVLRVAAINSVGDFILFLGKVAVMTGTGAIGILMFKGDPNLHYFFIPVLLVFVFSYFIAHGFLSIYEMVIDALLLCFCEDCQINDGVTPGREYYMDPSLMKFVKNSSEAIAALNKRRDGGGEDVTDGGVPARESTPLRGEQPSPGGKADVTDDQQQETARI